jgi:membrane-associated phospholipid phosphatase
MMSAPLAAFSSRSPSTWLVPIIAAAVFAMLVGTGANQQAFLLLNSIGPHSSDDLWANITILGDTLVAFALCLPLWRRRPDLLWALAIGALFSTAWVHVLKPLAAVPRPPAVLGEAVHVIGPAYRAGSFPSGHATTSFLLAGLVVMGLGSRTLALAALGIAVVATLSRSVVGVHWPLDLLAGAFGGWLSAAIGLALARRTLAFGMQSWVQWTIGLILAGGAVALVVGAKTGYPQAVWFERVIGATCLAATAVLLWQEMRRR